MINVHGYYDKPRITCSLRLVHAFVASTKLCHTHLCRPIKSVDLEYYVDAAHNIHEYTMTL